MKRKGSYKMKIGDFEIKINRSKKKVWIFVIKGEFQGEGMEIDIDKFEKCISDFYDKEF